MGRMWYKVDGKEGRREEFRFKEAEVRKPEICTLCFEKNKTI